MRFCGKCGSPLTGSGDKISIVLEPSLAPINEIGMLIGSDLKQRFRQAGLESAGQRRIVTVLFADLCDYTGLSGKIDDESLYEFIQLYIRMLAEKVYQFEGMVDKITGDGLMALFGAPIAYENPAERAVRAALEMQAGLEKLNQNLEDRLGEKLQMHFGLNRGSVIVGGIGSDLLIDYTAIGDSVNLARRLQETASPNTILVSESVYQTTQALFNYQELADLDLKGYQGGEKGYQLLGVKSQPAPVRGIQGLSSRDGIQSAIWAQSGITGVRDMIDGKFGFFHLFSDGEAKIDALSQGLGERFEGAANLSFKFYPGCRCLNDPTMATLQLVQEHDITPEQVREVTVGITPLCYDLAGHPLWSSLLITRPLRRIGALDNG